MGIMFCIHTNKDVSGNARKGRSRRTYTGLIGKVLEKGQVRSTRNSRNWHIMYVNVTNGIWKIVAGGVL